MRMAFHSLLQSAVVDIQAKSIKVTLDWGAKNPPAIEKVSGQGHFILFLKSP